MRQYGLYILRFFQVLRSKLPEKTLRRLFKVLVRSFHLVGIAGVFSIAIAQTAMTSYVILTAISGIILVIMEIFSGWIWFVQLRGVALYLKLMLLGLIHLHPQYASSYLIASILISGFFSHAPSWIRYFSLLHGRVVRSREEMLG
jgi:ABC-type multidrug transport system permease subunit